MMHETTKDTLSPPERKMLRGGREPGWWRNWFGEQTLAFQFVVASGILIVVAAGIAGLLITEQVSKNTLNNRAAASALFMQSILSPFAEELATGRILSRSSMETLDQVFSDQEFRSRFPHLELWRADGTIVYSTSSELIGKRFDPPSGLVQARKGNVVSDFTDLHAAEHTTRLFTTPYLEIYSPVRAADGGTIVAVAEIQEESGPLKQEMFEVRLSSWLIVAGASALILLCLFGIVRRGSMTIEIQRNKLLQRAAEAERVSDQVRVLSDRARLATVRLTDSNEKLARQIGADLHDGPAQLIGFAVLQIDAARRSKTKADRESTLQIIGKTLDDALGEIRMIAKALLLPDIERLDLEQVIGRAIRLHEARTGTIVAVDIVRVDLRLPTPIKTCVFRFLQEGLNNAYKHADSNGQKVECRFVEGSLFVRVHDKGHQNGLSPPGKTVGGMGIEGLRQRVESFGGTLSFEYRPTGSVLVMILPLDEKLMRPWTASSGPAAV
ncbi:Signal transduction histidine-protein kinase/phosphatase UhpB [Ensifer sp. M14]|uniref:histidine kinase n=1 Tax=Sinorhizobium sp. M14 TaxID=430451 RepID=A0A142BPS5_9HYPH|nr:MULTISPECIES: histidine kinase [Sinorhizobium/Ensifer group]AMP35083.1 signal transduction histidine kinase [Sinorhizobium sp. M14]RDL48059.1 Signal transduction histidine-protein kinase/phosphatase UhpB [Ensifer sp. M14]